MFNKIRKSTLNTGLLAAIFLSLLSLSYAATPNPGHPWTEFGDGNFIVSGPTAPRTYTFPDAAGSVLTTSSVVTIAQGGTSDYSGFPLGYALKSSGSSLSNVFMGPGLLLGDTDAQSLLQSNLYFSNNTFTDTGITAMDLLKSNGTKFVRFATTTALSYLKTNAAGTDLEWGTLSSVAGSDTELQYNSGGSSWGATSSLSISGNVLHLDNLLTMSTTTLPTVATTGTLRLFSRRIAGREFLKFRTEVTDDYSTLQPNIFSNYFCLITTGNSSSAALGCPTVTGSGTASQVDGYTTRSTFNTTAVWLSSGASMFVRGTTSGGQNGFFYFVRTTLPDATYANSSGVRLVYGLSDQTAANTVCGSDNVSNQDLIGFNYSTALSANWRIAADDGSASTPTYVDTGMPFTASTTYDFYIYAPPFPATSTIYWKMENLTTGTTTAEGVATTQLPGAAVMLQSGMCGDSVNSVTRNWRVETMYTEIPR